MPRESKNLDAPASEETPPAPRAKTAAKPKPKPKAKAKTKPKPKTKATAAKSPAPKAAAPRKPRPAGWRRRREQKNFVPLTSIKNVPLGYRLMAIAHVYSTTLTNALHQRPDTATLTVPQLQALQLLDANGDACNAELARAMLVQPQSMTSIASSLRARGLISELEAEDGQGRATVIVLTPKGRQTLTAARKTLKDVEQRLSEAYSYDEREIKALETMLDVGLRTLLKDPQ